MFDYLEKIKDREKVISPEMKLSITDNIRINTGLITHLNIDEISDEELSRICMDDYQQILKFAFEDISVLKRLFSNHRFVMAFSSAMYRVELTEQQKTQICNTIFALTRKLEDRNLNLLLMNLGKIVNRNIVPILMDIGFSEDLSGEIAVARFSSAQPFKQVSRINRILLNIKEEVNENTIIRLYEKLGYFSHFTDLFEGIMYDKMDLSNLSDHQREIYSTISNALIDVVEEIPNDLRYTLLLNFVDATKIRSGVEIRFNLKSCNRADYPRINQTIDELDVQGKYIPF